MFGEITIGITKEYIPLITPARLHEKYLYKPQITSDHQLNPHASVHDPRIDKQAKFP
jgi:hypothetical protein